MTGETSTNEESFSLEQGLGETAAVIAALQRFQEMRESGEFCCLEILSDFDYVWGMSYERYEKGRSSGRRIVGQYNSNTLDEALNEAYDLWKSGRLDENSRPRRSSATWLEPVSRTNGRRRTGTN